jgi:hypothetical protein
MRAMHATNILTIPISPLSSAELTSILAADLVYDFLNVLAGGVDGRDIKEKTAVHEEL